MYGCFTCRSIDIYSVYLIFQRMMALYVASHYKNSPNDLQLMADAPAHHLFVLLGMFQIDLRACQFNMMALLYSTNLCSLFARPG